MNRLLFIGQAPPRVAVGAPFDRSHLYAWLANISIPKEAALRDFMFTALVSHFPGSDKHGHKAPTLSEIAAERPRIRLLIAQVNPSAIVPVGTLAIRELLGDPLAALSSTVGNTYQVTIPGSRQPHTIIPLPHPSGASPWIHMADNKALLIKALEHIRDNATGR